MVTPSDGATDVGPNARVVLTFSESLNANTINSDNFALFANGQRLGGVSRSSDNRTVTLSASLPPATMVTVVATDGVEDLSGNWLADFTSQFSTAPSYDTTRPRVVTQRPASGANEVAVDASVVLYVDESLNEATIPGALHIAPVPHTDQTVIRFAGVPGCDQQIGASLCQCF